MLPELTLIIVLALLLLALHHLTKRPPRPARSLDEARRERQHLERRR
jgi:hypothetical protein